MAQVRNISDVALNVGSVNGRRVDPDEILDVTDAEFVDRLWPLSTWELVEAPAVGRDVSISDAIHYTTETEV